MTANNGYPLSAPWEGFGSSPELDGPITRDGNEKNPPPALLNDPCPIDQLFTCPPARINLATRGPSVRPSTNWFLRKLSRVYSSPYAAVHMAQRDPPSPIPGLSWSGIGNFASGPTNDTIIGSHHWVPGTSQADLIAGLQSFMPPSFIAPIAESYPLGAVDTTNGTSQGFYGTSNDLQSYSGSLPSPVNSGYTNYNTHAPLNRSSVSLYGDCFNALDPHHHIPPIEYPGPSVDMCTREVSSTGPGQSDLHDSSLRPPKAKKRNTQRGRNGGNERKKSCTFCQLAKVECGGKPSVTGEPCARCSMIALHNGLAVRFCGYDLEAFNIRGGIVDFYNFSERRFGAISVTQDQPTRSIILTHPLQKFGNSVINFPDAPTLELVCHEDDGATDLGWAGTEETQNLLQCLSKFMVSEFTIHEKLQPGGVMELWICRGPHSKSYVFLKDSLPDRETLLKWGNFDIMSLHKIAPGDVETALTAFLTAYVGRKDTDAPYGDLANKLLELVSLSRMLDSRRPVQQDEHLKVLSSVLPKEHGKPRVFQGSISVQEYNSWKNSAGLSLRARSQLFAHVVAWIEPLERSILKMVDHHLNRRAKKRQWEGDPMILGLIVRRMCLYYRRNMIRYKQFGETIASRNQNNQAMLDILTAHYGYIFKGTLSPFHDEWKAEKHERLLGNDLVLIELLDDVKTAEKYHYLNELDNDFDNGYKRLVTDHETKQHSTLAKQWNDGSEPSLLSESLESIQDPQAFELWSLSFDEGGGQPGSKHSSPADDFIMEMEPSDSDEEPSGSSVSTGVQSRQSSVQQSRQPTPEPPQKPQEGPATMNSNECQDAPTSQPGASEVPLKQEFLQLTGPKAWEMLSFRVLV